MRNHRKKFVKILSLVISAAMLLNLSASVYGYYNDDFWDAWENWGDWEDWEGFWDDYLENTTTTPYTPDNPPEETTTSEDPTQTTTPPDGSVSPQTTPGTGDVPPQTTPPDDETTTPPDDETTTPDVSQETTTTTALPLQMGLTFLERWLEVGEGVQLGAKVLNTDVNYPISFSSSNTNVVIVDTSGYILAVGAGSATVTAYYGDIRNSARIYVTEPPVVPEFLVLTESRFLLKIDETAVIKARLLPEEAAEGYSITFTSEDPSIASVDENGTITALKAGETVITVEGAGLSETVTVTVSSDVAYDTARLDGYIYDGTGKPIMGSHLKIGNLDAITDRNGYFVFDSVEQRSLTIRLADDENASCGLTVSGDTTVYLLYDNGELKRVASYDELAGLLSINSVTFDSENIVLTAGEIYELKYIYEPSDAAITAINYSSSNTIAAAVGQVDGVITAKSAGETVITISLNNGQAIAECYVTVNPRESSEYSWLIVTIEAAVFATVAAVVMLGYKSYKRRALKALDEEEEEEDLHDID